MMGGVRRSKARSHLPPIPATRRGEAELDPETRKVAEETVSDDPNWKMGRGSPEAGVEVGEAFRDFEEGLAALEREY